MTRYKLLIAIELLRIAGVIGQRGFNRLARALMFVSALFIKDLRA